MSPPSIGNSQSNRLARGVLYNLATYLLFFVSNLGVHLVLVRCLDVAVYGGLAALLSLVTLMDTFVYQGMMDAVSRSVPRADQGFSALFRAGNKIQASVASAIILLCGLALWVAKSSNAAVDLGIWVPGLLSVVPWALIAVPLGSLNGKRRFGKVALVTSLNGITRTCLVIALALATRNPSSIVWGYALALLPGLALAYWFVAPELDASSEPSGIGLVHAAFLLTATHVLSVLLNTSDLITFKLTSNSSVGPGYYAAASNISRAFAAICVPFTSALLPSVSIARDNTSAVRSYCRQSVTYVALIILPIAAFVASSGDDLALLLFSSRYAESGKLLRILPWAGVALGFLKVFGTILVASLAVAHCMVAFGISVALQILAVGFLGTKLGAEGAAYGVLGTALVGLGTAAIMLKHAGLWQMDVGRMVRIAVGAGAVYWTGHVLQYGGMAIVVEAFVCCVVYAVALVVTGFFRSEDVSIVRDLLFLKVKIRMRNDK